MFPLHKLDLRTKAEATEVFREDFNLTVFSAMLPEKCNEAEPRNRGSDDRLGEIQFQALAALTWRGRPPSQHMRKPGLFEFRTATDGSRDTADHMVGEIA